MLGVRYVHVHRVLYSSEDSPECVYTIPAGGSGIPIPGTVQYPHIYGVLTHTTYVSNTVFIESGRYNVYVCPAVCVKCSVIVVPVLSLT